MTKRIAITGATGTIGTVLRKQLGNDYELTLFDKQPVEDLCSNERFVLMDLGKNSINNRLLLDDNLHEHDVLIHLAWNTVEENFRSDQSVPENKTMVENILRVCFPEQTMDLTLPKRIILASSIHASGGYLTKTPYSRVLNGRQYKLALNPKFSLIRPEVVRPDSPYGATKVWMEALGKHYADRAGGLLDIICIRFGGINPQNSPSIDEVGYRSFWLSHRDCGQLVRRCIETDILGDFLIVHGISNNHYKVHDISNARKMLGYQPEDDGYYPKLL